MLFYTEVKRKVDTKGIYHVNRKIKPAKTSNFLELFIIFRCKMVGDYKPEIRVQ